MPQPNPPSSVLIIGGSLSGLMHALTLLTHSPSTKIKVLERSGGGLLHNQGAGVVAGGEVQQFFDRYILHNSPAASGVRTAGGEKKKLEMGVTSQQRLYLDKGGEVVEGSVEMREQKMVGWDGLYRLLRWRVDGLEGGGYLSNIFGQEGAKKEIEKEEEKEEKEEEEEGGKAEYVNGCTVTSLESLPSSSSSSSSSSSNVGGVKVVYKDEEGVEKSETADLVIAADGGSSVVRKQLLPEVKRKYVGYVAFRGTVPELDISLSAKEVFVEKFAFFHAEGLQILAYVIPGEEGTLKEGERLVNWVWYCNYAEDSAEFEELMTDKEGKRHAFTLPVGGMREDVWEKQKRYAEEVLPPQYAELVGKTTKPFVQCITDVISPENSFMDGKVLLVGDALAGFRPHTAASTGQGAFDALTFAELLQGNIDRNEYNMRVMEFAQRVQKHGVYLGERSQFGRHPLAG